MPSDGARIRDVTPAEADAGETCLCNGPPSTVFLYGCGSGHTIKQFMCPGCVNIFGSYERVKPSVCVHCFAEARNWHKRAFDVRLRQGDSR